MNPAINDSGNAGKATPLSHLFLYIRDLFHTGEPILDFKSQKLPFWELAELKSWVQHSEQDLLSLQFQDLTQPLLSIQMGEPDELSIPHELADWVEIKDSTTTPPYLYVHQERIHVFEDHPGREDAFEKFRIKVEGKPVEQVLQEPIPAILRGWVDIQLENDQIRLAKKDARERLSANAHRVEMLEMFKRIFQQRAAYNWHIQQINQLYERLHTLFYEIKSQSQNQLYLSFGLVSGKIGGKIYQNFLFHVPLSIQLSQQTLHIYADPLAYPVNGEQTFTPLLAQHFAEASSASAEQKERDVIQLIENFNHRAVSLSFHPEYISQNFYHTAKDILRIFPNLEDNFFGEKGERIPDIQEDTDSSFISLNYAPVIQMRKEEPRLHISQDAGRIVEKLQTLEEKNLVPDFFRNLFSLRSPDNPLRVVHKADERFKPSATHLPPINPSRPVLFPLPFNEEQRAIIDRLDQEDAVTVQGPPGTGKSHTIANIMSHYAALGKSVLIVSKYGKALDVIKNKLPDALKHLVLSWVEADQQHEQLKYAIDAIKDQLNRNYSLSEIDALEKKLAEIDTRYAEIQAELEKLLQPDSSSLTFQNPFSGKKETRRGSIWARWAFENPYNIKYIQDSFESFQQIEEDLAEQLASYMSLYSSLSRPSLKYVDLDLPNPETWLKVDQLIHYASRLKSLSKEVDLSAFAQQDLSQLSDQYSERWAALQVHLQALESHHNWIQSPNYSFSDLNRFLAHHKDLMFSTPQSVEEHVFDIDVMEGMEPEQILTECLLLREKFGENEKLSLFKRNTLSKVHKRLLQCQVDRLPIESLAQLNIFIEYADHLCKEKKLGIVLENFFQKMGWTFQAGQVKGQLKSLNKLQEAQIALTEFNAFAKTQGLSPFDFTTGEFAPQKKYFSQLSDVKNYREVKDAFETCLYPLRQSQGMALPLIHQLMQSAEALDVEAYQNQLSEYLTFRDKVHEAKRWTEAGKMLQRVLPKTFESVTSLLQDQEAPPLPDFEDLKKQLDKDLFHLELSHELKRLVSPFSHTSEIFEELEQLKSQRERTVGELILHKTWYHKSQTLTDEQRAALTAWRNDIINIGKGHGKNADRNLSSAIQNMRRAKSVVPIWIMQQDTAIKFFADPEPGQFDLLIIDEASQCDISMVNLIFRAQKCMIVGDENQTAASIPSSIFPIQRTNSILDRYLDQHPFKEQFNINNRASSIYALSGVIYPNIVTLLEHFRCRPEIIGYSNRHVYNHQMLPLKTATENYWGEPLVVEYVEEESLKKKRIHIAERVKTHIVEILEQFEQGLIPKVPSVGVLSLDSSNEPHLDHLIKVLSATKLIRKYADSLDLLIGTARKFQGDERDIMILTSTAISRKNAKGSLRPPRGLLSEEMMRIYNVAASRAREKSILIHCIAPEAVAAMNPNCYRKKLIDYYTDSELHIPKKPTELGDILKELPKEKRELYRDVCIYLFDQGYGKYVKPNYKLGTYQLDIALLSQGKKIAILFDSSPKKDPTSRFNELITLKRVGWQFFYLPEMLWFFDSTQTQKKLSKWLKETLK